MRILNNRKFQKAIFFFIIAGIINLFIVPFLLWWCVDLKYAINYFFKIGIGVLYLGFTLGSLALYNSKEAGELKIRRLKKRVKKAKLLADKGKAKVLQEEETNYYNVIADNYKVNNLKKLCDSMSLFLRAGVIILTMIVFMSYFRDSETMINTDYDYIQQEIECQNQEAIELTKRMTRMEIDHNNTIRNLQNEIKQLIELLDNLQREKSPKQKG